MHAADRRRLGHGILIPLHKQPDAHHQNQPAAEKADGNLISKEKIRQERQAKGADAGVETVGHRGPKSREQTGPDAEAPGPLDGHGAHGAHRQAKQQSNQDSSQ